MRSYRLCFVTSDNIGRARVQIMQEDKQVYKCENNTLDKNSLKGIFTTNIQRNIAVSSLENSQRLKLHVIL